MVRLGLPYITVMLWLVTSHHPIKCPKSKIQMSNHKNANHDDDATDQMLDATKRYVVPPPREDREAKRNTSLFLLF